MQTRRLTEDEFKGTLAWPVRNVQETATDVLEIWPYVHSVPADDLEGHVLDAPYLDGVYRTAEDRFDHVIVMTRTKNVYLVIVVDLIRDSIYGHWLLDLNREYGLS